jgi:hypothetical protein
MIVIDYQNIFIVLATGNVSSRSLLFPVFVNT